MYFKRTVSLYTIYAFVYVGTASLCVWRLLDCLASKVIAGTGKSSYGRGYLYLYMYMYVSS